MHEGERKRRGKKRGEKVRKRVKIEEVKGVREKTVNL